MRWPWVSAARLDAERERRIAEVDALKASHAEAMEFARRENEWLRKNAEDLKDRIVRMDRFKAGMPEAPRGGVAKEKKPMPPKLANWIGQWGEPGSNMQKQMLREAFKRHSLNGESWDEIMKDVMQEEPYQGAVADG